MNIILTHEQADFDALASLLGAYLLDESYIPVLPRKMNRNVGAFVTLYGAELPFCEAPDLPQNEAVEVVTLVDTQSMISIRGMSPETQVHVIDHHPLRDDLPIAWKITISGVGANTTLFVETLRERDLMLNMIQSTLLLLGIYEDTGSLTYTRTTPRDLRAASYLLEQGASLQIANDFLNHPLSQSQQDIYDQLRANVKYFDINGHTIIIACGDAQEMEEELSTVAHKLRDLLDPDALFVLIETRGGIQLIARSTSENIDVSQVAIQFGGGGHERASASMIKNRSMTDICDELVSILPEHVFPAVTVAQIMSRNPQLLSPETPVRDISNRMQRFGHEGYPVARDGKIIGLVTRRDVDRTMNHKLNLSAESIMNAGEYTVKPEDSIEYLQKIMTDTGWGQIPVVQPETGQIIGIVTRTDLLKTLTPKSRIPSRQNLAERLARALPPVHLELINAVAKQASEQRVALYVVGGFVRDLLIDLPSLDYDLVVEGDAIALAYGLAEKYGGRVTHHSRFGTAKWLLKDHAMHWTRLGDQTKIDSGEILDLPDSLDLVSARTEFYSHPTALPTVEMGSIKLDLHRRDFTINTLALRLDGSHYGELHDYWGGLADLRQGIVRVLHSLSFVDDPTRILRAVRFEQRFGFRIEARTLELLTQALPLLARLSGDRIRHEINIILLESRASFVLTRLNDLGILKAIHKDLEWDEWLQRCFERLHTAQFDAGWLDYCDVADPETRVKLLFTLWFIRLSPGRALNASQRLKLPSELRRIIQSGIKLWQELPLKQYTKISDLTFRLDEVDSLALSAIYVATQEESTREKLLNYVQVWRKISPSINGDRLRFLGIPPGPVYREILHRLRQAWLDGEIKSIKDEAKLIETLIGTLVANNTNRGA
jgi:tRNA nucleotidyltransferase (CCA-adding enzyme)